MAVAFVKNVGSVSQGGGGSTTFTITVPAGGVALNNRVVLRIQTGADSTINSVADTGGNTYTLRQDRVQPPEGWLYDAHIGTALVSGNTIVVTFSAKQTGDAVADEFSGVLSGTTDDGTNGAAGSSSTPSSGAIVPTVVGLVYGALVRTSTSVTEDSDNAGGDTWHSLTNAGKTFGAYKITTSAVSQTYDPTLAGSTTWVCEIVALKQAASGTTYTKAGYATENRVA